MNIKLLTRRGREIIDALIEYGSAKAAALKLGLTQRTILESLQTSRRRVSVKSTWELVAKYAVAKALAEAAHV